MNFSILYRVLWKPSEVFKGFLAKPRPEPCILISVIIVILTIKTYINNIQRLLDQPSLFFIGLIQGYFFLLFLPTLYALFTLIVIRFSQQTKTRFMILVSAFILCNIPQYIPSLLKMVFRLPAIYLGSLIPSLNNLNPSLSGIIAILNPFFMWSVILWWVALTQMFDFRKWQAMLSIVGLILITIMTIGLWSALAILVFNRYNPAS